MTDFRELYLTALRRGKREHDNYLIVNGINHELTAALLSIFEGDVPPHEIQEFAKAAILKSEEERKKVKFGETAEPTACSSSSL